MSRPINFLPDRGPTRGNQRWLLWLFLWLPLTAGTAAGKTDPALSLSLGDATGGFFQARDVSVTLHPLPPNPGRAEIQIEYLQVARIATLKKIRLLCENLLVTGPDLICPTAVITGTSDPGGDFTLVAEFVYRAHSARLTISTQPFFLFGGRHHLRFATRFGEASETALTLTTENLDLEKAAALLPGLQPYSPAGTLHGRFHFQSAAAGPGKAQVNLTLSDTSFSSASGKQAGEKLGLRATLNAETNHTAGWRFSLRGELRDGQLYVDPLYLDLATGSLGWNTSGVTDQEFARWEIEDIQLAQEGVFEAQAMGRGQLLAERNWLPDRARLTLEIHNLGRFYPTYLEPFTFGWGLGKISLTGHLRAEVTLSNGVADELQLDVREIDLQDAANRFAVFGVHGKGAWSRTGQSRPLTLSWRSGNLYRFELGATELAGALRSDSLYLSQVRLPLLDGALVLNDLEVGGWFSGTSHGTVSARLEPVSMRSFTKALEWPDMSGHLAGNIPRIRWNTGELKLDGQIDIRVFDGSVVVRQLRMSDLFGRLPELSADLQLDNLDLAAITDTFDFGSISGRLEGYVRNLTLAEWRLVRMDAFLRSPEGGTESRKISQRAVNNLTSINGGATAALQRSLLRFFEEFSYRRLGIRCRLIGDICFMDGIEQKGDAYYIVQGGGWWPRIDVVGFNREVLWPELLRRLRAVSESGPPLVE